MPFKLFFPFGLRSRVKIEDFERSQGLLLAVELKGFEASPSPKGKKAFKLHSQQQPLASLREELERLSIFSSFLREARTQSVGSS